MKRFIIIFSALITVACLLSSCNKGSYEDGYKDGYAEGCRDGYEDGYKAGLHDSHDSASSGDSFADEFIDKYLGDDSSSTPVSEPLSGTILSGKEYADSEITVTADSGSSYVISLKNVNGTGLLSFYVRAGETVTVGVPAEYLYVYFASGTSWYGYGPGLMFGEETIYSKDDEVLDFTEYTWEYTLYPVQDGNFTETPSDVTDFFG